MKIFLFLLRHSRSLALGSIAAGLVSGLGSALFMTQVGKSIVHPPSSRYSQALFLGLATLLYLGSSLVAQLLLNALSQNSLMSLRMDLCEKILGTSLKRTEEIGSHRLLSALTDDVNTISYAMVNIPAVCVQSATLVSGLAFLLWLCPAPVAIWMIISTIGLAFYLRLQKKAQAEYSAARAKENDLFRHLESLTDGAKELKLNRFKRRVFFQELLTGTADQVRSRIRHGMDIYSFARTWGEFLFQTFFFLLLVGFPLFHPFSQEIISRSVVAFLFLTTPVIILANLAPVFARSEAAIANIESIGLHLNPSADVVPDSTLDPGSSLRAKPYSNSLRLDSIVFRHTRDGEDGIFTVGPIDLEFHPGEVTFLVGGNGSGKTTLAKTITGLYAPAQGRILLDGTPVAQDIECYRELFSVVFSDFHLFERILVDWKTTPDERVLELLHLMKLSHKVSLKDGRFSTSDLSSGQRKRLALIEAILEDRPFYVFDEWAADQDPIFKDVFYTKLVPHLRSQGKSVLVISHDDRYFHLGDRMVHLENGTILESSRPSSPTASMNDSCRFLSFAESP